MSKPSGAKHDYHVNKKERSGPKQCAPWLYDLWRIDVNRGGFGSRYLKEATG